MVSRTSSKVFSDLVLNNGKLPVNTQFITSSKFKFNVKFKLEGFRAGFKVSPSYFISS